MGWYAQIYMPHIDITWALFWKKSIWFSWNFKVDFYFVIKFSKSVFGQSHTEIPLPMFHYMPRCRLIKLLWVGLERNLQRPLAIR